jgi:hypothetical protein
MNYETHHHNRNWGCRVVELIYAGYRAVVLENEKLRVTVLADKGTDIFEFLYKPLDVDFLWRSRIGLRPRRHFLPTTPRAGGLHGDYFEGGWPELFPNCGAMSIHQGAEIGQHGEVLLLPWDYSITRDEPDEIVVRFDVRTVRTPFHVTKTMTLRRGEAVLRIHEEVVNEGGQSVDYTWGHHPVLGWPFLDEHCRVDLPECRIRVLPEFSPPTSRLQPDQTCPWPRAAGINGEIVDLSQIPAPGAAAEDMVFLEGMTDCWYAITNTHRKVGFGLRYPTEVFKVLWYWQVYRGGLGYPWWGGTYNIALEPCATFPILSRAVERGEALRLNPGEKTEIDLLAVAYERLEAINGIDPEGRVY